MFFFKRSCSLLIRACAFATKNFEKHATVLVQFYMSCTTGAKIVKGQSRNPQLEAKNYILAKIRDCLVTDLQTLERQLLYLTRSFLNLQVGASLDFSSVELDIYELALNVAEIMRRAAQMSSTSNEDLAEYVNNFWEDVFFEIKN